MCPYREFEHYFIPSHRTHLASYLYLLLALCAVHCMLIPSGLAQVLKLRALGIYCTDDGRISIAGLNHHNVATVAAAIHTVTST